ncbi:MAG TPA: carbonic anhydrase [Ktedonobacterales bacterium]
MGPAVIDMLGVVVLVALIVGAVIISRSRPRSTSDATTPTQELPAQPAPPAVPTLPTPAAVPSGQLSPSNQEPTIQETKEEQSMPHNATFATLITCIDGRVQRPLNDWVRDAAQATYVDTVTIPGPDLALTAGPPERINAVRQDVEISLRAHGSRFVAVAGHFGCAANPVTPEEHQQMIRQAVGAVERWGLHDDEGQPVRVVGLWVNDSWQAEVVPA